MEPIVRIITVAAALAMLGANAYVTITEKGLGFASPYAILFITITAGVAVASIRIGSLLAGQRRLAAVGVGLALLSGEAFGLTQTAERLIEQRQAAQLPAIQAVAAQKAARLDVEAAQAVLVATATSPRLEAALKAKAQADRAVIENASLSGCRSNCRKLLQAAVDAAAVEVADTRAVLQRKRVRAEARLAQADAALAGIKVPQSGNALAERLGVEPFYYDLFVAALGSVSINVLACILLAGAAHRGLGSATLEAAPLTPVKATSDKAKPKPLRQSLPATAKQLSAPAVRGSMDEIDLFASQTLLPAEGYVSLADVRAQYETWCGRNQRSPLDQSKFFQQLSVIARAAGIEIAKQGDVQVLQGVAFEAT